MKKVGEFNGFKIWVPEIDDMVMSQEPFMSLKYRIESTCAMVPVMPQNPELGGSEKPSHNTSSPKLPDTIECTKHALSEFNNDYFNVTPSMLIGCVRDFIAGKIGR